MLLIRHRPGVAARQIAAQPCRRIGADRPRRHRTIDILLAVYMPKLPCFPQAQAALIAQVC